MFVVGSGGSSSACSLLSILHQERGHIASAITPLELQHSKNAINKNVNIAFISASGKNSDILFAFDTAIKKEPANVINFCLKKNSPLSNKSSKFSISTMVDFENPAGKDGFLATNSLVAYFTILSRIYENTTQIKEIYPSDEYLSNIYNFSKLLHEDFTITVLYAGWGKPVALDIESKFSEAGLGNILLSDYRNFGHGRHNWFDKKKKQSAIIALITNEDEELANKTLELLPKEIPVLKIKSEYESSNSSIDLLVKSFYFVEEIGKLKNIDPGKPGVPDYGSKLYHLKYSKYYPEIKVVSDKSKYAIARKLGNIDVLVGQDILSYWIKSYTKYIAKLNKAKFKAILLDYDGTICSTEERFNAPRKEIIQKLEYFLENNIKVGLITGRGKSVRENLQKLISEKYWDNFIIGYYNGAQIGTLSNNNLPLKENSDTVFNEIEKLLLSEPLVSDFTEIELRKGQLTVQVTDKNNSEIIKNTMKDILKNKYHFNIQILESSHSIDIISVDTSKNLIIDYCRNLLKDKKSDFNFLCIGDRGKWPGNDYQLLSNEFSLSVDEVSSDPNTCWNLATVGKNCVEATLEYFEAIEIINDGFFKIKF